MNELVLLLKSEHPEFVFRVGKKHSFRPPKTIYVDPGAENCDLLTLHELGHALCGHSDFDTDAKRLRMEREAWERARGLAERYGVSFDESVVEEELNSYREWLDKRSRCKRCGLTMYQTPDRVYHCPRCESLT